MSRFAEGYLGYSLENCTPYGFVYWVVTLSRWSWPLSIFHQLTRRGCKRSHTTVWKEKRNFHGGFYICYYFTYHTHISHSKLTNGPILAANGSFVCQCPSLLYKAENTVNWSSTLRYRQLCLLFTSFTTQNVYFCLQTAVRTPPHPADERDSYRGRNAGV